MNIFAINNNPKQCAEVLDDKRVVKMVLETAQLLSNAQHIVLGTGFYKKTHINHPCSRWVAASYGNYAWAKQLFISLLDEYYARFKKNHKCAEKLPNINNISYTVFPTTQMTPFANCTPHKDLETFTAYKITLSEKWKNDKRPPKWTNKQRPFWA